MSRDAFQNTIVKSRYIFRYKEGLNKDKSRLVENELTTAQGNGHSTSVCAVSVVAAVAVDTVSVYRRATVSDNLDVVVGRRAIVWVGNQRKVRDTVGVPGTKVQRSPVTDTRARSTPNASVLLRNSGVVDVKLSRRLHSSPVEVVVGVNTGQGAGGARVHDGWNDHVLSTWVVGLTNGNATGQLRGNYSLVDTPFTQVLGGGVGSVQEATFTGQATDRDTVARLVGRPLSLGHTWLTSVRAVSALGTGATGRSVCVVDTRPSTET